MTTVTKYGKYILRPAKSNLSQPPAPGKPVVFQGLKDWGGIQHRMYWSFINCPILLIGTPHSHKFDEIMGFYSCDPAKELDFDAKIELTLGKEKEKQVINTPSVICIPKGLVHGPLNFISVDRPIMFWQIFLGHDDATKPT